MAKPTKPDKPTAKAPYGYTKAGKQRKRPARGGGEIKSEGRPTLYDSNYHPNQAYRSALLGLKDPEIAVTIGIAESTLNLWKNEHPEFIESLKSGREKADEAVVASLYKKACDGDTVACFFWLKNRHPDKWRDRREMKLEIDDLREKTDKELDEELAAIGYEGD